MTDRQVQRAECSFGVWPILSLSLAALVAGAALPNAAVAGTALPSGGKVTAGAATISASGGAETIDQTSARAIIDWSSFSLGKGGKLTFDNGAGATLNEVSGGSAAQIQGLLSGTGSVFVIDPSGVVIGRSGVVQTGGTFVAATLAPSTSRFLANAPMVYAGKSTAQVVNLGRIGSLGGDVALIGLTVANRGQISAARGDVGLMAGSEVVVRDRLLNDGKFDVVRGDKGTSATNTGTIQAAEAELRANGGNVYALAGNAGGVIEATGVSSDDGKVFLVADGGTTVAHGQIDATSADGSGGHVETSGARVNFDGASVRAGDWLIDPTDLTVNAAAATTISNNLATTSVTLKTTTSGATGPGVQTSGPGDIIIDAPISWSSGETLTLYAHNAIAIDAPITVAGAGGVVLYTKGVGLYTPQGPEYGLQGNYSFGLGPNGFAGSLSFTGTPGGGQTLTIEKTPYTLLYSVADLVGINATGLSGDYALATSLNAGGATYTAGLIGSQSGAFAGIFTGLGHTISDLTINAPGGEFSVGLFVTVSGTVRDIGLVGGSTSAGAGENVGALVGDNSGTVVDSFATGTVGSSGGGGFGEGGLVGWSSQGVIANSYATGAVSGGGGSPGSGGEGGLVGFNGGLIVNAYATGAVTSGANLSDIGGLVGEDQGTEPGCCSSAPFTAGKILNSYASGAVSGFSEVGGLVGYDNAGAISNSYAQGAVSGAGQDVGGLAGLLDGSYFGKSEGSLSGTITSSYATGAVSGGSDVGGLVGSVGPLGDVSVSYATGAVSASGQDVGGLVGDVSGALGYEGSQGVSYGAIGGAYATGAVSGGSAVGGLVGYVDFYSQVNDVYATGAVKGSSMIGGLVGAAKSHISDGYYDADTTGRPAGTLSNGSIGLTTAQLQGALPAGFSSSVWGTGTGLYPYLISFYPTTPQAISGFAFNSNGGTVGGAQVGVYEDGSLLDGGAASSGANGYFYELVPGGTVSASTRLGETITLSGASGPSGLSYTDQPTLSSGNVVSFGVTADAVHEITSDALESETGFDAFSTFGGSYNGILFSIDGVRASWFITATAPGGYTVDADMASFRNATIKASGSLTITADVEALDVLTLVSGGVIDASHSTIFAGVLTGSSVGGADFNFNREAITTLGNFSNTGGGAFSLSDNVPLHVTGRVFNDGDITIGTGGSLEITGTIYAQGHTLTLASGGVISARNATLKAAALAGDSFDGAALTGAGNRIGDLDSFRNTLGVFSLTDSEALEVVGPVRAGDVTLTTTSGNLTVTGKIKAAGHTLTLTSAGAITTTGAKLEYKKLVENPNTP